MDTTQRHKENKTLLFSMFSVVKKNHRDSTTLWSLDKRHFEMYPAYRNTVRLTKKY
jgi:hypothetical protein